MLNCALFAFVCKYLVIHIIEFTIQAHVPLGYVGCFKDSASERTLENYRKEQIKNNNGELCKRECTKKDFRYAGTENGNLCFCGNSIAYHRQPGTGCDVPCPNSETEFCGGFWFISIYDTRATNSTSSLQKGKAGTDTIDGFHPSTSSFLNSTKERHLEKDDKNTTALIIALPLALAAALLLCALLACRFRRSKKKDQNHELKVQDQGSVQNIYAVCADSKSEDAHTIKYINLNKLSTGSNSTLQTVASDDTYNSLQRRMQRFSRTDSVNSYDHLKGVNHHSIDQTYSYLSQEQRTEHQYINCTINGPSVQISGDNLNRYEYSKVFFRYTTNEHGEEKNNFNLVTEDSDYDHSATLEKQNKRHYPLENEYSHFSESVV